MKGHKAVKRFSKAWIELAIEQDALEASKGDAQLIIDTLAESRDLAVLLKSPVVKQDMKFNIMKAIFGGKVHDLTASFIRILISKKREQLLESICKSFIDEYKLTKNIVTAEVLTAVQIGSDEKDRLKAIANSIHSGNIELKETVDSELIGGFVLQVGDKQIDESISRKLNEIKRRVSHNPYIVNL